MSSTCPPIELLVRYQEGRPRVRSINVEDSFSLSLSNAYSPNKLCTFLFETHSTRDNDTKLEKRSRTETKLKFLSGCLHPSFREVSKL